jgi:hypothetical protein
MDGAALVEESYVLGARVPPLRIRNRETMVVPSPVLGDRSASKVVARDDAAATTTDPCAAKNAPQNLCEKPASSQSGALPIALGVM